MNKRLFFILIYLQLIFPAIIWAEIRNPFVPQLPKEEVIRQEPINKNPIPEPPGPKPKLEPEPEIKKLEPEIIEPPTLNIKGLIWNTNRPQAIINDQVVNLGDTVSEAEIIAIRKSEVDILFKGQKMTIKL